MYFEGRELTSYSKPVSKSQLKKGEVYFMLAFMDRMLVPIFQALVFIGVNLEPEDDDKVYFQDYASYQRGITYSSTAVGDAEFHRFSENQLDMIFRYEDALDELMKCSLRRTAALGRKA